MARSQYTAEGIARAHAREQNEAYEADYQAGYHEVPKHEHFGEGQPAQERRDAYEAGRADRQRERRAGRAQAGRRIAGRATEHLRSAGSVIRSGATEGSGSWVGIGIVVLGVIALYVLLVNPKGKAAAVGAINGVFGFTKWLVAPKTVPF